MLMSNIAMETNILSYVGDIVSMIYLLCALSTLLKNNTMILLILAILTHVYSVIIVDSLVIPHVAIYVFIHSYIINKDWLGTYNPKFYIHRIMGSITMLLGITVWILITFASPISKAINYNTNSLLGKYFTLISIMASLMVFIGFQLIFHSSLEEATSSKYFINTTICLVGILLPIYFFIIIFIYPLNTNVVILAYNLNYLIFIFANIVITSCIIIILYYNKNQKHNYSFIITYIFILIVATIVISVLLAQYEYVVIMVNLVNLLFFYSYIITRYLVVEDTPHELIETKDPISA